LLNCEQPSEIFLPSLNTRNDQRCLSPSLEEVKYQIQNLKNHKSPGEDQIVAEFIKNGGDELTKRLWMIITKIWETEELPEDLKTAIICPIYKKGDIKDCNNYRGIAQLNVTYKIFTNCILSRIKETAENAIGDYQGGFRPGRSTTDQIFIVRQLIQKTWEFNKEMHILFVDFQNAYDSIHREGLINTLAELNFPHK